MLLSLDGTFLLQMLNFALFWALLNYLFIAPTRRAIVARQRFMEQQYKEGDEFASVAATLRGQAEDVLADARRQTHEIMRTAAADAESEAKAIDERAADEANALVQAAQRTVAQERAQAESAQTPFVEELARTMVARATSLEAA